MSRPPQLRLMWWLGLALLVSVVAYGHSTVQRLNDRKEVANMTTKTQTVCVGRFLIDLPAHAGYHINGADVAGFRVSWADESHQQFITRISSREAELGAIKNSLGRQNIESVKTVNANGFTGKIFTFGRSSTHTLDGDVPQVWESVNIEGYVNGNGKSFNFIAEEYDPAQANNLPQLLAQLREVPPGTIPVEPGFCFGPGMLLDPVTAYMAEKIVLFAGLPGHPDIAIAFNTMAGMKPTFPGLLARRAKAAAGQPIWVRARFSTLRSAPRTVNGLVGEEAVTKVTEHNFSQVYGFDWEFAGAEDNVLTPAMHLEMSTGNNPQAGGPPLQSSLGQQALLELWDRIASSIRVRPTTASAVLEAPTLSGVAIGAVGYAGDVCPASGWWACVPDSAYGKVLGGERQYLKLGQRMPQALSLRPQTLWEKVRRVQAAIESKTSTVWKLVDRRNKQRVVPPVSLDAAKAGPTDINASFTITAPPTPNMLVATGHPCPASGWWRCTEMNALDGARWFAQGSLLPLATFAMPDYHLANQTRGPQLIRRRVGWQLARLESHPECGQTGAKPFQGNNSSDESDV